MPILPRASRSFLGDNFVKSTLLTSTDPVSGFSNKFTHRMSVLLPAPLYPMTPYISPFLTEIETSFNASIEPFFPVKLFEIPVSSIICKVTPYLFKCAVVYLCPVFRPTHCGSQRRCHRKWHSYSEFLSVGACSYPIVDLFFIHLPY